VRILPVEFACFRLGVGNPGPGPGPAGGPSRAESGPPGWAAAGPPGGHIPNPSRDSRNLEIPALEIGTQGEILSGYMAGADPGQIGVPGPNFELEPEIPLIIPATSIFPAQSGRAGKGGIRIMIRALISPGEHSG
jgi:hypothetical protein